MDATGTRGFRPFVLGLPAMRSGMMWVNCYKRANPGSPFGGTGKSGYGREIGFAAMAEYTTRKSVWINVDAALPDWSAQ
jgi:aldehyde dehydrogenase (NAD+)